MAVDDKLLLLLNDPVLDVVALRLSGSVKEEINDTDSDMLIDVLAVGERVVVCNVCKMVMDCVGLLVFDVEKDAVADKLPSSDGVAVALKERLVVLNVSV